jgi:hypothetical protein
MVHVRAVRDSGPKVTLGVRSGGRNVSHVAEQVFNISVGVLLHSTGSRRNPSTESRELGGIWLVTTSDAVLLKVSLEVLTGNTGTDTGHVVLLVDPPDLVHATHVNGDDHTSLGSAELEGLGHVGAAAVGNQNNAVLNG